MNKIDFILLYDVTDANPNGDPDGGNMPRADLNTNQGIVTDVCLKRKIRNYIELISSTKEFLDKYETGTKRFEIFVKEKAILNKQQERAVEELGKDATVDDKRGWMCEHFYDIRTFGAVMSTGSDEQGKDDSEDRETSSDDKGKSKKKPKKKDANCGQVRGPVQISFSRSIDSIYPQEHSLTRCAVTKVEDAEKERTMGRKYTVPYGLYMAKGTVNPFLASCKDKDGNEKGTGFDENDLELFKEALVHMFDFDASAARPAGSMVMRKVILFQHGNELGSAPAHKLYELLKVAKKPGVEVPRSYADYDVQLAKEQLPSEVAVEEL